MFQIALSKLTPFDTQIITLITLAPDKWVVSTMRSHALYNHDFGTFGKSLYGFGLQSRDQMSTNKGRRLSWRGQILLRREWRKILSSAVDPKAETLFPPVVQGPIPRRSKMGGVKPPAGQVQVGQTATQVAAQQAQANQHLSALATQMAAHVNKRMMQTLTAQIGTSRDDALDAIKYNFHQMGAKLLPPIAVPPVPAPAVSPLTNATFWGKSKNELLAAGAPQSLVDLAFTGKRNQFGEHPVDQMLAEWCARNLH